ncbi:amino acid adenylation domain-containing protein [Streptomyces sp. NPDC127106]|uniref:amino acid adenylation domain-containing protein n=1 Tax=Streptomyces sp. NPDC127106 TaxID=3345360 RepID=UPI0036412E7D
MSHSPHAPAAFERGPVRPYPRGLTLPRIVADRAARTPGATALRWGTTEVTYRELVVRARRLGDLLRDVHRVERGAVVAVLDAPSARAVTLFLGILYAGAAYLPLDEANPVERNRLMTADAGACVVVAADRHRAEWPGALSMEELMDRVSGPVHPDDPAGPDPDTGPLDAAYVMYTSGSTGRPKGIAVPHRAVSRLVVNTDYVRLAPGDTVAHASNTSFDASTFEIWGALLNGATAAGLDKELLLLPDELPDALAAAGITTLFLTPALFHLHAAHAPAAYRGLRALLLGGDAPDPAAAREVLAAGAPGRLLNMYGPTEATTFSTGLLVTPRAAAGGALTIGRPIANTTVRVLAEGRRVPVGEQGELHIGGDGLALGYPGRPELTAERFLPDAFRPDERLYRSGDLVSWNPDGTLRFHGRADHQVKVRGFRIELGEIETALRAHPDVTEAAVISEGEGMSRKLIGFIAKRSGAPESDLAAEVAENISAHLPSYMLPSEIVSLPALPMNANGKVDRRQLPNLRKVPGLLHSLARGAAL